MSVEKNNIEAKTRKNFNYYISKFFLDNTRLTFLAFILLIAGGVISTLSLKTSGFPNPEIKIALVNTVFPGASSETVLNDITLPLEGVIKDVEGVKRFNSNSLESFSNIVVTIEEDADSDTVKNRLETAVNSVTLPEGSQDIQILSPEVGGPDFGLVLVSRNKQELYKLSEQFIESLSESESTASIEPINPISQKVIVKISEDKLTETGVLESDIIKQLQALGQTFPVVSDVTLDNQRKSIVTTIDANGLDQVKNLEFTVNPPSLSPVQSGSIPNLSSANPNLSIPESVSEPKSYLLGEIAEIELDYFFVDNNQEILDFEKSYYAYNDNSDGEVVSSVTFIVKTASGADLASYSEDLKNRVNNIDGLKFVNNSEISDKDITSQSYIVESFSINDDNEQQVKEVVSGLIGNGESSLGVFGWLLGGIQLVFLVMLIFVSWRAAVLAALAIPLSLAFTTIYLAIIGESLNTLVLFSLVLVIGLVVDPALVILESIQRKIDEGKKGKESALEAISDVGDGLFSSTLTNIIVFLPLAVVSGILGQIFSYIPLTIIPALVGSYLIAIVFFPWLGSIFLTRSKGSTEDEEKNLWPIARSIFNFNYKLLNSNPIWRILVIILGLIIPIATTGFLFGTERLKSVQFSSDKNSSLLTLNGSYLPSIPLEERVTITEKILQKLSDNQAVIDIYQIRPGFDYYLNLKDKEQRGEFSDLNSFDFADKISQEIQQEFGDKFFDINISVISNGPPQPDYQVNLAINSNNLETLRTSSLSVAEVIRNQVCKTTSNEIIITENCNDGQLIVTKVDDGYTNRDSKQVEVVLDKDLLLENNLVLPGEAPFSIYVREQIAGQFKVSSRQDTVILEIDDSEAGVILEKDLNDITNIQELEQLELTNLIGQKVPLTDVATIRETEPKATITRLQGSTVNQIQIRLNRENTNNQGLAAQVGQAIVDYYAENDAKRAKELGLQEDGVEVYSEGGSAEFVRTFQELGIALLIAIFLIYGVLVALFNSFGLPLTILFTIPLTFIGAFPGLAVFVGDEFGFLEIIGIIILTGLVVNVAIYLIDTAKQKIEEGWEAKKAISFASGLRLRAVILTNLTAIASLAPLFFTSDFYRSISTVIIFGLTTSAVTSLFTTPILFIFFRDISKFIKGIFTKDINNEKNNLDKPLDSNEKVVKIRPKHMVRQPLD